MEILCSNCADIFFFSLSVGAVLLVTALKSAKGDESFTKALHFDKRKTRLEDNWHKQQFFPDIIYYQGDWFR